MKGLVVCGTVLFFAAAFALPITALIMAKNEAHVACVGQYNGIKLSYGQWLVVYGATSIAIVGTMLAILACLNSLPCIYIGLGVLGLQAAFQFAWFVVGAILLFKAVTPECDSTSPVYAFGLALFIIQVVAIVCAVRNRKSVVVYKSNQRSAKEVVSSKARDTTVDIRGG